MKTSLILSIDTRHARKNGTCPIIFRLSHNRQTTSIKTGYFVEPKFWSKEKSKIFNSYKGYRNIPEINSDLLTGLLEKREVLIKLHNSNELSSLSVKDLRQKLEKTKPEGVSLTSFTLDLIKDLKEMKRFGTARAYTYMLESVSKHIGSNNDIPFSRITSTFLKEFEVAYISRGNSYNALSAILRSLRAVINKSETLKGENYPFSKYKIKQKQTAKRAISIEALNKILNLQIDEKHVCFETRNIFIISFYLWGINYKDLAYLKVGNIVDGRIQYQRAKTGKQFSIKILPEIQGIIDYYSNGKERSEFLLPIIKRESGEDRFKDVMWYRKRYNANLRELAQICGIEEKLTSYVARHSFATHAESVDIPIRVISNMLGHSKLATTEIYLKSLSQSKLDDFQDQIFNSIK